MSTSEISNKIKSLAKELKLNDYLVQIKRWNAEPEMITIFMYENLEMATEETISISYEMFSKDYTFEKMEKALRERYSQAVYEIQQEKDDHIAADRLDDEIWERNQPIQEALNRL